jgi:hypothetical protein
MEGEILRLAAAAPTRGLVEDLAERLGSQDLPGLAAEALTSGDLRAAINLALAGVLAGRPPSGELAVTLLPAIEDTQIAIRLLGSVESGLLDALLRASSSGRFTPGRQGLILFLAATLAGDPPPDELRRRIRLAARADLDPEARTLVGLAALEVGDPDVLEVAHECARGVDGPGGRRLRRDVLRRFRAPLREALPEDAPVERFAGFTVRREEPRVGRNEPCPCGSGRKYKKCCIGKEDRTDETPDAAVPWGDRARLHRSMTDDQFRALHPLELARLAPEELSTTRLIDAIQGLAPYRLFSEVDRFLAELDGRSDLPGGRTPDEVRADVLVWTLTALDREATTRVLAGVERPESLALAADLGLAVLARRPDALERIEEQAAEGLREPGSQALGKLCATLLFFSPALGILASRGALDTCHDTDVERLLEAIEEARDHLLLPPGDPAWELYDLLSDRRILEQLQTSVAERSEQLAHEARELRRAAATARAEEAAVRRELEQREAELARALTIAEESRAEVEEARRAAGPSPEDVSRLRRKVEEFRDRIAAGNEERRALRRRLSSVRTRLAAAAEREPEPAGEPEPDDLEVDHDADPDRRHVRLPSFGRELAEAVRSVPEHVARDAIVLAGALAGTDPAAWFTVKRIKSVEGVLSSRIGRYRLLFRLVGDDGIAFLRLIHRRDLEVTLRRMD